MSRLPFVVGVLVIASSAGCALESGGSHAPSMERDLSAPGGGGSTDGAPPPTMNGAPTTGGSATTAGSGPTTSSVGTTGRSLAPDAGSDPGRPDAALQDAAVDGGPDSGQPEAAVAAQVDCVQDGRYALRFATSVLWETQTLLGVSVIKAGEGALWMTVLADLVHEGTELRGEVWPCDSTQPDFESTEIFGAEIYRAYFKPGVWESELMPRTPFRIELGCDQPGCVVRSDTFQVPLGILPSEDTAAPWPEDRNALEYVDHDDDGLPGVTLSLRGPSDDPEGYYSYLPVGVDDTSRIEAMQVGLRMTTQLRGALQSCQEMSGTAPMYTMETHVADCTPLGRQGGSCSPQQATLLDRNLAVWMSREVAFVGTKMDDGATCADAREAFPAPDSSE